MAYVFGLVTRRRHFWQKQISRVLSPNGLSYSAYKHDRAILDFDQAIRLDPGLAEAYAGRGYIFYLYEDYRPAMQHLNTAVTLDLDLAPAYSTRGLVYVAAEDFQDLLVPDVGRVGGNPFRVALGQTHAGFQSPADDARVVVNYEDYGDLVAYRCFHLHGVEAEGTIPIDAYHGNFRPGQLGAHRKGNADSHAAVGAGVQTAGRRVALQDLTSGRQGGLAVHGVDGVPREHLAYLV